MLSFHLLQNVMLADWAPPLLLLGLTAPMVAAVTARLPMDRIARPGVALGVWLVAWYAIHLPPVYDAALQSEAALGVEHLVFLVTGLLFWWPDIVDGYLSLRGRVIYLFIAMVAMMPLDIFIALYPRGLYSFYAHTEKLGGISVLADQRIAGAGALVAETLVLGTALGLAVARLVRAERRSSANATAVGGTSRVPPTAVSMPPR
jgi:cytochrome c oxidase assembly factor CtaG